jgi:hypothetical protein
VRRTRGVAEPVAEYPTPSEGKYVPTVEVFSPAGFVRESVTMDVVGEPWPMPDGHHRAFPFQSKSKTPGSTALLQADAPSRRTNHDAGTEI